jgi:hypothetical protein
MVKAILLYGSETWSMTEMGMRRLSTREREMMGRIHEPLVQHGIWGKRAKQELREL